MRHIHLFATAAAVLSLLWGSNFYAAAKDAEGHTLTSLWKEYREATDKDLPQKRRATLEKIRVESMKSGLAWDFFDSCCERYYTEISIDWKNRGKASEAILSDARDFGNEAVVYRLMREGIVEGEISSEYIRDIINSKASILENTFTPELVSSDAGISFEERCPLFIKNRITNDYEYILWSVYFRRDFTARPYFSYPARPFFYGSDRSEVFVEVENELKRICSGQYPLDAFLEFAGIRDSVMESKEKASVNREAALKKFASDHSGKAISLLARQELLLSEMNRLEELVGKKGMSPEELSSRFMKLREKCQALKDETKSFKGVEAEVAKACSKPSEMIASMDAKSVTAIPGEKVFRLVMKNTTEAGFSLHKDSPEGPEILSVKAKDKRRLYHVPDTVDIALPPLGDGEWHYSISSDTRTEGNFSIESLSLASRQDGNGNIAFYSAWQDSGEPVGKADLTFVQKGKTVLELKGFLFDGFTSLDKNALETLSSLKGSYSVTCSFTDEDGLFRTSPALSLYRSGVTSLSTSNNEERISCAIYKDSPAYRPADTLKFKVIGYKTNSDLSMEVLPEGHVLNAVLENPDGKTIISKKLTINDFGSASCQMTFPSEGKNGRYRLAVYDGNTLLGSRSIQVDDFVLPSWTIGFGKGSRTFFEGETVILEGLIRSFSGHNVVASLNATITDGNGNPLPSEVSQDDCGRFRIRFKAPSNDYRRMGYFTVCVKATDIGGETAEAVTSVWVRSSLNLSLNVENRAQSRCDHVIPDSDSLILSCRTSFSERKFDVRYTLSDKGNAVLNMEGVTGENCVMDISMLSSGIYELEAVAEATLDGGRKVVDSCKISIMKIADNVSALDFNCPVFIMRTDDGFVLGGTDGPVWAVAELYGPSGNVLLSESLHISGTRGSEGSLKRVCYNFSPDMPDEVSLNVFWFRNSQSYNFSTSFTRPEEPYTLPLEVSRFTDLTVPGGLCSFTFRTLADCEGVAAVYDKSIETLVKDIWYPIPVSKATTVRPFIIRRSGGIREAMETPTPLFSMKSTSYSRMGASVAENSADLAAAAPESVEGVVSEEEDAAGSVEENIREDFRTSLAFKPFLRSDKNGEIAFSFNASDKISTFVVQMLVHDKLMRSAVTRREITVTMPVKVSLNPPQFLYCGDSPAFEAVVSSVYGETVPGTVSIFLYNGEDYKSQEPFYSASAYVEVPANGASSSRFDISIPETDVLGIKVVFTADKDLIYGTSGGRISDGIFLTVPVMKPVQTLVEAHSAVLGPGDSWESVEETLRNSFVNVLPYGAEYREISLRALILEAVPHDHLPEGKDVLSLAKSLYINVMSSHLRGSEVDVDTIMEEIAAYRNPDGGFGWFEGMKSSPALTACLLEWAGLLRENLGSSFLEAYMETISEAVHYLDHQELGSQSRPWWYGGISQDQYLYIRSVFRDIPFDRSAIPAASLKKFHKYASEYLIPQKERGLHGDIHGKALRMITLLNLNDKSGERLCKEMGIKALKKNKIVNSVKRDLMSMMEYATPHPSGGLYYPNAATSSSGLLDGDLYVHSMICDLFARISESVGFEDFAEESDKIADGLRLRMMLAKESNDWSDDDPASVNAINSILSGSPALLETKILVMSKRYVKQFPEITASNNGFSINRSFFRCGEDGKYEEIADGEELKVGDKVKAVYSVSNSQKRSFVRLTAPRFANLQPINQLSGTCGGWWKMADDGWGIIPQGYREVRPDRTIWYFDTYPEFDTSIEEEFHVVRAGRFQSPAVEIESLYASHYRANSPAAKILHSTE
ncbi:MAG: MG2 domain-containing protein [Candidatus Cryptobacteroides sp.]